MNSCDFIFTGCVVGLALLLVGCDKRVGFNPKDTETTCECEILSDCCSGCSFINQDGVCQENGAECTTGTCSDGICNYVLKPDQCFIDSECYVRDSKNPENDCEFCNPSNGETGALFWSDVQLGTVCEDASYVTIDGSCNGQGACEGTPLCVLAEVNCDRWPVYSMPTGYDQCWEGSVQTDCDNVGGRLGPLDNDCALVDGTESCGQDGQYPDIAIGGGRYYPAVIEDTTLVVVDGLTGLMWQAREAIPNGSIPCSLREPHLPSLTDEGTGIYCSKEEEELLSERNYWFGARFYCEEYLNSIEFGKYADWRLPDAFELAGLVQYGQGFPLSKFPGVAMQSDHFFWSSSVYLSSVDESQAWKVSIQDGIVSYGAKTQSDYLVRCVRGDHYDVEEIGRYTQDSSGSTIIDGLTGLQWQKVASSTSLQWYEAMKYCETGGGADVGGETDWRLPTIHEQRSLLSYEITEPSSRFPGMAPSWFWSSSGDVNSDEDAWVTNFSTGYISSSSKNLDYLVRCVRLGP